MPPVIIENEDTIAEWIAERFPPGQDELFKRFSRCYEELTEAAVNANIPLPFIIRFVTVSYNKSRPEGHLAIGGEIADVYICLVALARHLGFTLTQLVQPRMERNRLRDPEYYERKQLEKKETGLL